MKNLSGFVKLLGIPVLLAGWTACSNTYIGEGEPVAEFRETGKFDKLVLNMNAIVYVTDTTVNFCTVLAQKNIQEAIITRLDGTTLVITNKGTVVTSEPIEIQIGMSQAAAFEVNGSGAVNGLNTIKNDQLDFEVNGSGTLQLDVVAVKVTGAVSGSGSVNLKGASNDLNVEINGSGKVDAHTFSTLRSKARIAGSGAIDLFVAESLDADVGGSGVVSYRGNAVVKQQVSGSGKVVKLD